MGAISVVRGRRSASLTAMQTILGAGGVIGVGLLEELSHFTSSVRAVSRRVHAARGTVEQVQADLTDPVDTRRAIAGSKVVYLVAGLPYETAAWRRDWPRVMDNVIAGCREAGSRLVFFDNVYAYGRLRGAATESTASDPVAEKGVVRAAIAGRLLQAMAAGEVEALIARAADFYGPGATNTFVHSMVFTALARGQKAAWLVNDEVPHSFTYTPDAARATAVLGNTPDAFGQIWHLPTRADPPTGRRFIELAATELDTSPDYRVLRPWMMRMAGLFNPLARESVEMLYQYEKPYVISSAKYESRFGPATSYEDGIRRTAAWVQAGSHPNQRSDGIGQP
jgi:nucleoside-diphosphate-sugar epimerase